MKTLTQRLLEKQRAELGRQPNECERQLYEEKFAKETFFTGRSALESLRNICHFVGHGGGCGPILTEEQIAQRLVQQKIVKNKEEAMNLLPQVTKYKFHASKPVLTCHRFLSAYNQEKKINVYMITSDFVDP